MQSSPDLIDRKQRPNLPQLTSLRFFAAMAIVFHHLYLVKYFRSTSIYLCTLFESLGASVAFFFVLSGFILTYTYYRPNSHISPKSFYVARIARIYPIYIIGFAISLPNAIKYLSLPNSQGCMHDILIPIPLDISLLQAWLPNYAIKINAPGWSLSAEAFFYAVFPFLFSQKLITRFSCAPWMSAITIWLCGVLPGIALLLAFPMQMPIELNYFHSFFPLFRLPEFMLGILLGILFLNGYRIKFVQPTIIVATTSVFLFLAWPNNHMQFLGHNMLLAPLFATIIWGMASGFNTRIGRIFSYPQLTILGEASFSMYIIHMPFKSICTAIWTRFGLEPKSSAFICTYLLALIIASIIAHTFIETPARVWMRSRLTGKSNSSHA